MKIIFTILIFLYNGKINAQIIKEVSENSETTARILPTKSQTKMLDTFIFKSNELDNEPFFKGSFKDLLKDHLLYPKKAKENGIQGKVVIDFKVDKKGNLSEVKLSENSGTKNEELVKESLRIIELTNFNWQAGKKYGKYVKCYYSQSIDFIIKEEDKKEIQQFGDINGEKIYTKVDIEPKYIGEFKKFLAANLHYPTAAIEKNIQGTVLLEFVIDKNGKISNIKLSQNSPQKNELLVNESIRIFKLSDGNWMPAMLNGEKVNSLHSQHLSFVHFEE